MPRRLLIIGAGPMGLAAALEGVERGFDVTVLEKAEVGAGLDRWGPTRFFTPLSMNVSPAMRRVLGGRLPSEETLLTGPEMVDAVLRPLAQSPALAGRIRAGHEVLSVGRAGLTRMDFGGHPLRAERPFRVLARRDGEESVFEAEALMDASGVTGQPNALGAGGVPAPGESRMDGRIIRDLGALAERAGGLAGRRILLAGHGHSAATAILRLSEIAGRHPATRVTWAVRSPNRRPCMEVANDPLPERARITAGANDLAADPAPYLTVHRRAAAEALSDGRGAVEARFSGDRSGEFDEIVSLTGYRPDLTFLSELPLEISPSTEGAGRLSRALANVTDCLSVPAIAPADLASGEPGFFLIGAKSYGRARTFLLQTGLAQLERIFELLH
ncbi:MAG: NAD(P)-binding domain-containing protein [Thermoanaerobaculia bacterium]